MNIDPHRSRRTQRRVAAFLATTAVALAGALALVEPQAIAEEASTSHVVVTQEYNADYFGTIGQAATEMAVGMFGFQSRVLKVGGVEVGPVASYHGSQQVQVDYVLLHSRDASGFPTRRVVGTKSVSFAAGADATQSVDLLPVFFTVPAESEYYTVQYELHWSGGTSVVDGFSVQATIEANDDGGAYDCVVTGCSLAGVNWAGDAATAIRF